MTEKKPSSDSTLFPDLDESRISKRGAEQEALGMLFGQNRNIAEIPLPSQENLVLYDLIYCLTGLQGSYITPEDTSTDSLDNIKGIKFKISSQIHISFRNIIEEILPLTTHYTCVQKFTEKASFSNCGKVLQAFSRAVKDLLNDYLMLLAQLECELEAKSLTLQKMLFYTRPTLAVMEVLAEVVTDIQLNKLRGGQALTYLYEKINSLTGDEESQKFLMKLIQSSAVPYVDMLQLWIQKGLINDPQQEFLIEDNESMEPQSDYSYKNRYKLHPERVPCFLEKVSDLILRTGKYLNVIRQCGKNIAPLPNIKLEFSLTNHKHIAIIEDAHRFASKRLLEVLMQDNDLMGHLNSVKRYLLLCQGDFITQFLDACEGELTKKVDKVVPMKLENLLGLVLSLSAARNDVYKDDVHCELLTYDLITQISRITEKDEELLPSPSCLNLTGLECFAFRFDVKWPVSLVLSPSSILQYQVLFRQLFYCKHVERQLCKIWKENSIAKKFSPPAAALYRSAFSLRQRMMNAVQNLEYYMMIEVIEPNWHSFIEKMQKVENVDEVLLLHQDFLDMCLRNCFLSETVSLTRLILKLCRICLKFCEFIHKSQRFFLDAELKSMLRDDDSDDDSGGDSERDANQNQDESTLAPTETFSERVKHFDADFTETLIGLLCQTNDLALKNPADRFMNLVHRINFKSYYGEQMDKYKGKDTSSSTTTTTTATSKSKVHQGI